MNRADVSDAKQIGRRHTYTIFFGLGMLLYALVPTAGATGHLALFVALFSVILTMYGGGFATIPAYIADLFGVGFVSAIHGRLLTAWSTAGILGPVLINYVREFQIGRGVPPADSYTFTMYALALFLVGGLACNLAIRPVPERLFAVGPVTGRAPREALLDQSPAPARRPAGQWAAVGAAWMLAATPLAWGVLKTLTMASQMFR